MGIPERDLVTMSAIGAQTTSKETYATVRLALEDVNAGCYGKNFTIFLQGSYGNDTNILKESDVDVVIRLDSIFTYDISPLPAEQQAAFRAVHGNAPYTHSNFRADVLETLYARFGDSVEEGSKAVLIKALHNRRKTDVLIATEHRRYSRFIAVGNQTEVTGISFHKLDGTRVANYPAQHRQNLISRNQASNEWLKRIVRIFKNARQKMIEEGVLGKGIAPSYFIEGLLYNVPLDRFGPDYTTSMVDTINWLWDADRSSFRCANEQYALLDGNRDVSWNATNCDLFLAGLVQLWNDW